MISVERAVDLSAADTARLVPLLVEATLSLLIMAHARYYLTRHPMVGF